VSEPVEPVPIERLEVGLVLVPVHGPDGVPLTFIFDTGAGITALTPATAARLGVVQGHDIEADAVGGTVTLTLGRCPELQVGGTVVHDLRVAVLELPDEVEAKLGRPIDGVLGRSFFEESDLALDLGAGTLTSYPPHAFRRGAVDLPDDGVQFRLRGGVILVPVALGNADAEPVVLDLGANRTLVRRSSAGDAAITPAEGAMQGADGLLLPVVGEVPLAVHLGTVDLGVVTASVCDDADCGKFLGSEAANIGIDAMGRRTIWLSYADRRLWISP
jgi:hypothetical protein